MARTMAPGITPQDREFAPRGLYDSDGRKADAEAWQKAQEPIGDDILAATTQDKVEYYYAKAQQAANDYNCGVLLHFFRIPQFQHTPSSLDAVLVPADEGVAEPPPPLEIPPAIRSSVR